MWKFIIGALLALAAVVGFEEWKHDRERAKLLAEQDKAVAAVAAEVNATKADLVSAQTLIAALERSKIAAAGKLIKSGAIPTTYGTITAKLNDTARGEEKTEAGAPCPTSWADEYHRFAVDLKSGLLTRRQSFSLDLAILRSPSGAQQYTSTQLHEYDPVSGAEIPSTGAVVVAHVAINDEKPPGPGRWHLRGIAAVDYRGAPGVGAYAEPIPHVTLGAIGLYSPSQKDFRGVLYGGYRLLTSTISVGPYFGVSSKGGTLVGGVAATLEFTR